MDRNNSISIIAEIKKASPSKGIIRESFDHLSIADIYFNQEVNAVSVLTDINFFQGNITFLNDIAKIKSAPEKNPITFFRRQSFPFLFRIFSIPFPSITSPTK